MIDGVPIIVGAGPAGLGTAIQLKRYGISPLVLEKDSIGGLLRNANLVENYPGFPAGIPGIELVQLIKQHARASGVDVSFTDVKKVVYQDGYFKVDAGDHAYRSSILVVASGTKPRTFHSLKIPPSLQERVFYEVYPLLGRHGLRVAIVGGGDAAFDYALNLAKGNDVLVLNRSQQLKCLPLLWERAQSDSKIKYIENAAITEIRAHGSQGMQLLCEGPEGSFDTTADYLIGAIGRDPQLDFLSTAIRETRHELVEQGALYFVGDVVRGIYRQTAISVGDGILAAMKIYRYIKETHK